MLKRHTLISMSFGRLRVHRIRVRSRRCCAEKQPNSSCHCSFTYSCTYTHTWTSFRRRHWKCCIVGKRNNSFSIVVRPTTCILTLPVIRRLCNRNAEFRRRRSFVVWTISHILTLKEHVDLTERRPTRHLTVPAFPHQIKDLFRAVCRPGQPLLLTVAVVTVTAVLDHLLVAQLVKWLLPRQRQDLPQCHGE